ncbi:MAG: nuclear transport factor 2 family protein [Clostridium butyricum]
MMLLGTTLLFGSLAGCSTINNNSTKNKDISQESSANPSDDKSKEALTNSQKAIAVLESLASGDKEPITNYINQDKYVQHNLSFADGRQTLLDALAPLKESASTAEVIRVFEDEDYVAVQMKYNLFGKGEQAAFDIFRFEDGLIVEHWDNLQNIQDANPSGHSMFDGSTQITDLDKTESNKNLVNNFVKDILMGENPDAITSYITDDNYLQHNPLIADGLTGLNEALEEFAKNGIYMVYDKIHLTVGQGNFVLVASEGTLGDVHTSFYDLFRVEDGKIVEHWDVVESILDESLNMNKNGKF